MYILRWHQRHFPPLCSVVETNDLLIGPFSLCRIRVKISSPQLSGSLPGRGRTEPQCVLQIGGSSLAILRSHLTAVAAQYKPTRRWSRLCTAHDCKSEHLQLFSCATTVGRATVYGMCQLLQKPTRLSIAGASCRPAGKGDSAAGHIRVGLYFDGGEVSEEGGQIRSFQLRGGSLRAVPIV